MHAFFETLRRGHSFAITGACYALGIIIAAHRLPMLSLAALSASAAICFLTKNEIRKFLWILVAALAAGELSASLALWRVDHEPYAALDGHHIAIEALALERPRYTDVASMKARILSVQRPSTRASESLVGRVALITFPPADPGPMPGRRLGIRGRLDLPGEARNEGEPAERDLLAEQGISVVLAVHRVADIRTLGVATGWDAWWARARLTAANAIESRLPPLEATVLEGILWGDRGNLPSSLRQEFSDTGTVHVLTTAGLHLGIMAAFVAWMLSLLPVPRPVRALVTIVAAWVYATLAGLHLPTVRAATMLSAGVAAVELGRGRSPSAIFATAALAVIAPHPLVLLTPSFAMSFACVIGIALLTPVLTAFGLRDGCGLPRWVVEVVRTSSAVQLAIWPLQALYFNAFTPYAVLANAIVVPLVAGIMASGSLLACSSLVWAPLTLPFANIAWWGLFLAIEAVKFFATLPGAHIDMPPPSHAFMTAYWVFLAGLAAAVKYEWPRTRMLVVSGASIASLIIIYCTPGIAALADRDIHLDAIDVGQADCLLVRAPGGHALLVDGGGRLERNGAGPVVAAPIGDRVATRTVLPFLLRHWVLHLDAVVLTHPHGDHAGGLPVILSHERVGALYDSAQLYSGPAYHRALAVMQERHIPWIHAQRGVTFELGPTTHVKVLEPEAPLITGTSSDINNNSVVLRVTFGHIAMLLTGDAQSEAEARMLTHGPGDLRADILKVGHHGSAYSSTPEFLAAVHPKIAIVSCGQHNVFGHPSLRTLAALQSVGAHVYRTDLDGGVSMVSDGAVFYVRSAIKTLPEPP